MPTQYRLTSASWPAAGVTGSVTATVTAPAGGEPVQTLAATIATGSGQPTVWFTPQTAGDYTLAWTSSGGQSGTTSITVAAAPTAATVITIQQCYLSLKMDPAAYVGKDPVRDADMLDYARAAQGVVESIVGAVAPATVTQVFDGGRSALLLRDRPSAILTVTAVGKPITGWSCDFAAGILTAAGGFPSGRRNIEVRYSVGSGQVPANVLLGIREVFRQLWERSRALGGAASSDMVMQGFAIPNAVYELLAPTPTMPGFA